MGLPSFCRRHIQRLGLSLRKRRDRTTTAVRDFIRRGSDKESEEIARKWRAGHCFPSFLLPISDPTIMDRWSDLRRYPSPLDDEELVKQWITQVRSHSMVTYDGMLSIASQVRYCEENGLPGVYVETGCHRGGSSALMARACLHYGKAPRPIHVFDSFEGLPQPDAAKDVDEWIAKEWGIPRELHTGKMVASGGLTGASEDDVRTVFKAVGYPLDHLHIHKGWFCDTLPVIVPQLDQIAILRLDGDLYASTWDALTHLYPKVIEGGFVVIDDYSITGARQAVTDYLKTLRRPPYISRADGTVFYFVKQD
jgi:O-methyltransferase